MRLALPGLITALALAAAGSTAQASVGNTALPATGSAAGTAASSTAPAPAAAQRVTPKITDAAGQPGAAAFASNRFIESGEASWYGPRHEGHRTTSGEVFNSHKLTAAHPSLPIGSYVRVTDEDNGRSIVVKVNDREPPHGVRCIDLSHEAAIRLGFAGRGIANVTLQTASADEAEEVAEAPDDAAGSAGVPHAGHRAVTARHGRPHRHHARR